MRPACLYVNLSINCSSNQSINLAFFFSPSFSRNVPLCTLPSPSPRRCFSLQQSNKQAASFSLFLPQHSVISIGFPCARAVLHRSIVFFQVLVLCRTVPTSFRSSPTKPSGSAPLVRPDDILLHRRVASTRIFPPAFVPDFLAVSHISLLAHFHPRT